MNKEQVTENLGNFLEYGVGRRRRLQSAKLSDGWIVDATSLVRMPFERAWRSLHSLFSDLFDGWGRFRGTEYESNADWRFSDYNQVKLTSQGIIAKLHRDVEKKKRRRAKKRA